MCHGGPAAVADGHRLREPEDPWSSAAGAAIRRVSTCGTLRVNCRPLGVSLYCVKVILGLSLGRGVIWKERTGQYVYHCVWIHFVPFLDP